MENPKLNPEITAMKDAYLSGKVVPDLEIALASFTVLDEYRKKPYPTPPKKVADYHHLSIDAKRKMNENPDKHLNFWMDSEVRKHFDTMAEIRHQNDRNLRWLKWMKKILEDHSDKIPALDVKIHQYNDSDQIEQPEWQHDQ